MNLALVASAHGYGHATRCVALADALVAAGHQATLYSTAPASVLGTAHPLVSWAADVGLVQPDSLGEDVSATLVALEGRCGDAAIDALAAQLTAYDGVVADIAPAALEAARRAGVPAVAMGNFDWAWTYGHYEGLRPWARRFTAWQAAYSAIQLRPGPDLTGFASVVAGGLLARRFPPVTPRWGRVARRAGFPTRPPPQAGKRSLEAGGEATVGGGRGERLPPFLDRVVASAQTAILVGFGGFGLPELGEVLPELPGVVWLFAPPMRAPQRPDCRFVEDVAFSALLAGADLVLTKPGYGMVAEAMLSGARLLYFDRGGFPEAPHLEAAMRARGDVKVGARPGEDAPGVVRSALREAVVNALSKPRPVPLPYDDSEGIAAAVVGLLRG